MPLGPQNQGQPTSTYFEDNPRPLPERLTDSTETSR